MKTILITGGSRGIGEAVVRRAAGSYNVAFTYKRNEQKAAQICAELIGTGGALALKCDVSLPEDVKAAVKRVRERYGRIDILVNNAGVSLSKLFQDTTDDDWRAVFGVNCDGAFYMCREVCEDMISRKEGAIVNVSSIWGVAGASMETAYSSSKAAVIGLTKALAKELAPSGVRVNAVAPGAVATDMMEEYSQAELAQLCGEIPLGRLADAGEVAEAVLYLAEAQYVTGQVLGVNGGLEI